VSDDDAAVLVENLHHAYDKPVLDGVSFRVGKGEIVGYLGPNGAGKSTTIKILLGMLAPQVGTVRVLGLDPVRDPMGVRTAVGYVPESGALYETLSPREYLTVVGRLRGLEADVVESRCATFLDAFGLLPQRDQRMTSFSKGMKQKVVIIASLLHDPKVLFLDEPLNGLDANATLVLKDVIKGLASRGTTVFYSSHLMDVVERISDRVVILDHGHVVADGSFATLRAGAGDASLEALFARLTAPSESEANAGRILDALGGGAGPATGPASAGRGP
jgi:ABC-2 type transport system ATP-binding protein